MSAVRPSNVWLSLGIALVGGYADAAGFLLANSFTGHVTGNLVLAAISIAGANGPTFFTRVLAVALLFSRNSLQRSLGTIRCELAILVFVPRHYGHRDNSACDCLLRVNFSSGGTASTVSQLYGNDHRLDQNGN